jgi:hypothetical protein
MITILKPYFYTYYIDMVFLVGGSKLSFETVTNQHKYRQLEKSEP